MQIYSNSVLLIPGLSKTDPLSSSDRSKALKNSSVQCGNWLVFFGEGELVGKQSTLSKNVKR